MPPRESHTAFATQVAHLSSTEGGLMFGEHIKTALSRSRPAVEAAK